MTGGPATRRQWDRTVGDSHRLPRPCKPQGPQPIPKTKPTPTTLSWKVHKTKTSSVQQGARSDSPPIASQTNPRHTSFSEQTGQLQRTALHRARARVGATPKRSQSHLAGKSPQKNRNGCWQRESHTSLRSNHSRPDPPPRFLLVRERTNTHKEVWCTCKAGGMPARRACGNETR